MSAFEEIKAAIYKMSKEEREEFQRFLTEYMQKHDFQDEDSDEPASTPKEKVKTAS